MIGQTRVTAFNSGSDIRIEEKADLIHLWVVDSTQLEHAKSVS